MEEIIYVNRKGTNSSKWDGQSAMFGEENLHAMWVADMDFQVPKCVIDALEKYVKFGVYGYMQVPDSYYDACINWEKEVSNITIDREWIRFSPGVVSAFHWIIQILTEEGDSIIVNTPVYYPFLQAVQNNNRILITSDLVNNCGKYSIDFMDFERKIIEHRVKVFILCSPHNPVGRVWTKKELENLFEICRRHQVYIIADEIHKDLVLKETEHTTSLLFKNDYDRLICLYAPSKTFNLAGCQNSEVIIPDRKIRGKWDDFILRIRINRGNSFGYIAAQAAYENGREWLRQVKKQIEMNYEYLCQIFQEKCPEVEISPLEGTYLAWINLGKCMDSSYVRRFVQKECRLAVDFGEWFGGEQYCGFIRMNLATSVENVRYAADKLISKLIEYRENIV